MLLCEKKFLNESIIITQTIKPGKQPEKLCVKIKHFTIQMQRYRQ